MFKRWLVVGILAAGLVAGAIAMGEKVAGNKTVEPFALPRNGLPSLVKLGANWCPPCRAMKPVLEDLAVELKGKVNVLDVDIDKHRELARQYKVSSIPTTIFFDKKGQPLGAVVGFQNKGQLKERLKALGLL